MTVKGRFDPLAGGLPTAGRGRHPGHLRSRNERSCPFVCKPPLHAATGLGPGQPPEGKLDGGDDKEGGQGLGEVFEILGQATISAEPREGELNHPSPGQDDETALDRLIISMRKTGILATAASTCRTL